MATTISRTDRSLARRTATVEEALDHAERIVAERGAGGVTVAEIARRMGIRPPSLYKYFPSLHGIHDGLFARGNARLAAYVDEGVAGMNPGLERLLEANRAILRWSAENPGLAPLLFWRPVPGFEPSEESYALAEAVTTRGRADLSAAVRAGELAPDADSDETFKLLISVVAGLGSQQMANEPQAGFDEGMFTSLTDRALDMFVRAHGGTLKGTAP